MFTWPTACALPPVIDPTGAITGAAHVYVVPAGTAPLIILTGVTVNAAALHTALTILVIAGVGFTVIANGREGPLFPQPLLAVTLTFPVTEVAEKLTVILFKFTGGISVTFKPGSKFHVYTETVGSLMTE
jgi:hypothetical protein